MTIPMSYVLPNQFSSPEPGPIRNIEPYLQSRVVGNTALLHWKNGLRAGQVYDRIESPEDDFFYLPSAEEIEEQIIGRFQEHKVVDVDLKTYPTSDTRNRVGRAIGESITYLLENYYGSAKNNGIAAAQLFNVDGKGITYNSTANQIITDGRRSYLSDIGKRHGIKALEIPYRDSMLGVSEVSKLFFRGDGNLEEYEGMALTHSTVTDIIPAVIQMGSLASDTARTKAGLKKMSGESKYGRASGADYVFFWPGDTITRTAPFTRAFDPDAGLELPAVWGIRDTEPLQEAGIGIKDGDWSNEKMIAGEVPLQMVSNLWVPPTVVDRYADILATHGYENVQVSSFPATVR